MTGHAIEAVYLAMKYGRLTLAEAREIAEGKGSPLERAAAVHFVAEAIPPLVAAGDKAETAACVLTIGRALRDADPMVRYQACGSCECLNCGAEAHLPALRDAAVYDPDDTVRRLAGNAARRVRAAVQARDEQAFKAALVGERKDQ